MSGHDALLKNFCKENVDLLEKARALLHTATIKTGRGSGYELGQGASGLPAICTYLAAERLGDTGINEQMAQSWSCLKPRIFETTLNTVRVALAAAEAATTPKKAKRSVTYRTLVDEKKIGRKATVTRWMQSAEHMLMESAEMRRKFGKLYDAITVTVFCWTCQLMKIKAEKIDASGLRESYNVSRDQFEELTDALHDLCSDVATEIANFIAEATPSKTTKRTSRDTSIPPPLPAPGSSKPSRSTSSTTRTREASIPPPIPVPGSSTPSRSVTRTPSKSALRAPSADLSPTKTPSNKRKVAFDRPIAEEDEEDEFDALATPSKKQKFSSPIKPPLPSATPRSSSRLASLAATAAAQRSVEDDEGTGETSIQAGPSTPRRQRTMLSQPPSTYSARSARGSSRSQSAVSGSALSTPRKRMTLPTVREEAEVPRRRCRPVFADQQQWLKGDARLERELRPWMEKWRELMKRADGDMWKAAGLARVAAR